MNFRTILILGALSAFGPLAIDFYLPAFPAMAAAFGGALAPRTARAVLNDAGDTRHRSQRSDQRRQMRLACGQCTLDRRMTARFDR